MQKTTRSATVIAAIATGIAGLALGAPLALAAPTPSAPTPAVTSTAKPTTATKPASTPTSNSTATASPTTTRTATNTPTTASKKAGALSVSVTAPATTTGPARVRISGLTTDVIAEVFRQGSEKVVSVGDAWGSAIKDGAVTVDVPAPKGGWVPGGYYVVKVTANAGTVVREGFTVPGGQQGSGQLQPPSRSTDPAVITMKSLKPGTRMSAFAGPYATDDIRTRTAGTVAKDGTITLSLPAPEGGWKKGQKYGVVVDQEGMGDHYWEASFTFTGGTGGAGGTSGGSAAKDSTGGLAKTGI